MGVCLCVGGWNSFQVVARAAAAVSQEQVLIHPATYCITVYLKYSVRWWYVL